MRITNAAGVTLRAWEALYAVHAPGSGPGVSFRIVSYLGAFSAPSNWLLIAAVNGDDDSVRLGVGAVLKPGGSWSGGADGRYAPLLPAIDDTLTLGGPSRRYATLYAASGAINTSDAREKTTVAPLTTAEIDAARALAGEIGTFRFHEAVARKGADARRHAGLTVQRAIAVMAAHGLDPFAYAFICRDAWDGKPATGGDEGPGEVVATGDPGREAGDRYGFRADELLLFIARGVDARLATLEGRS